MKCHERYAYYVPEVLKNKKCWVLWKLEPGKNGKITKVPKKPDTIPLTNASKTNPEHWHNYEFTYWRYQVLADKVNGIGVVFEKTMNLVFIDIDGCINPVTREIDERGTEFINLFPNTYCELSQSGTGLHFFVIGHIPRAFNNREYHIEMYFDKSYVAFTGNAIQPFEPAEYQEELDFVFAKYKTADRMQNNRSFAVNQITFASDQEILNKAMQNNRKLSDLYSGDWEPYYPSQSEADLYLCLKLAFWCERDQETIDRIFRTSSLYRSKWDEKHGAETYGQMTIQKACVGLEESYTEWKRRQQNEFTKCFLSEW